MRSLIYRYDRKSHSYKTREKCELSIHAQVPEFAYPAHARVTNFSSTAWSHLQVHV